MSRKMQLLESDIFARLTSMKYMPRWIVLMCDLLICCLSLTLAGILAHYTYANDSAFSSAAVFFKQASIFSAIALLSFWTFHTYSGVLRYSSFVDIMKLLAAVLMQVLLLFIVDGVFDALGSSLFMWLTVVFYAILAFLLLSLTRFLVKVSFDYLVANGASKPVAVYGTKSAGVGIAKLIRSSNTNKFRLAAFIDDEKTTDGKKIFDVPVISTCDKKRMLALLAKRKIRTIIVSPTKMAELDVEKDLDAFIDKNFEIMTVPSVTEWHEGVNLNEKHDFKNVRIEDLLNRLPIVISKDHIAEQVKGKVIMVTGAAGSIGSEIVRQVTKFNPKLLVLFDNAETPLHNLKLELDEMKPDCPYVTCIGDMRNRKRLADIITTYKPNIIYHAAAYKHVPMMEDSPCECIIANVMGTRNIADLAVENGVEKFVMVSTDKAVNPTNVMGASKRIAEIYVQSLFKKNVKENAETTKFITTRFGNVLGSNGSVIPLFRHQIEQGGPVTVTHPDIIRYFMTIPEACQLVLEAGSMGKGGEIFIFDMGRPVKIADLARKMIRLAGYRPEIDIQITYTGLRPGEKLYEELLNVKEATQPTYNEKILIANVREYDFEQVTADIDKLLEYAYLYKNFMVVSQMKHIVPEYVSKNSQYERLDISNTPPCNCLSISELDNRNEQLKMNNEE